MTFAQLRTLVPVAAALVAGAALAQPLAVKPGGWDMTMSLSVNGATPKLTPWKTCVTKEDLARDAAFQNDPDCQYRISARTATRFSGAVSCKNADMQTRGEFEMVAPSPDSITVKTTTQGSAGKGGAVTARMELKGHWASASCKGYDD
jgi:hypothetical protein